MASRPSHSANPSMLPLPPPPWSGTTMALTVTVCKVVEDTFKVVGGGQTHHEHPARAGRKDSEDALKSPWQRIDHPTAIDQLPFHRTKAGGL